jgi:hypothetical protein
MVGGPSSRPLSYRWLPRLLHSPALALTVLGPPLAVLAVVWLGLSVLGVLRPEAADYGEPIVYDHASRLVRGEALYQPLEREPYSVAAYTPVYYVLAALLRVLVGPGLGPGRALSCVAALITIALIGYITGRRARDWRAGLLVGLLFVGLGLPPVNGTPWTALYRVDTLGLALSIAAIAVLDGGTSRRRIALSIALIALAFLTKQTFVAAGVAGSVWLGRSDRRKGLCFAALALLLLAGVCLALQVGTGAFIANVVDGNLNPAHPQTLFANLFILLVFQAGPLTVVGVMLFSRIRGSSYLANDLLWIYWLATLPSVAGIGKVGSGYYYWMELAAATAMLAVLYVWKCSADPDAREKLGLRSLPVLLLAISVSLAAPLSLSSVSQGWAKFEASRQATVAWDDVLARAQAAPGDVLSGRRLDFLALAGRRIVLEPYIIAIRHSQGQWDAGPLVGRICAGEVGLLVVEHNLDDPPIVISGFSEWPEPVLAALRSSMVLERRLDRWYFYVPRQPDPSFDSPGSPCAGRAAGGEDISTRSASSRG